MVPISLHPWRVFQQASAPQTHDLKLGNESFLHKVWELFKGLHLHWALGGGRGWGAVVSLHRPFKRHSSVHQSPMGLLSVSPIGLQIQMFQGLISQVPVLKVGMPNGEYEFLAPWGKAPGFEVPLDYRPLCWGGIYGEIVSQPFRLTSI